jgi:hypothetical protein
VVVIQQPAPQVAYAVPAPGYVAPQPPPPFGLGLGVFIH